MEMLSGKILVFVLVFTRLSAFFLTVPIFSMRSIPGMIKLAIVMLVSIFFATKTSLPADAQQITTVQAGLMIANESIYGIALGLIAAIVFSAVRLGAQIIEQEMGLNMAEVIDPLTDEPGQPLGMLLETIFILLFLAANGHHLFLQMISRSFEVFPAGSTPTIAIMTDGVIQAGSAMFIAGLRIAAPVLAASLVLMVVLAILARIEPEMNILLISFPIKIGVGLMMTAIFIPFLSSFISEFVGWMGKLLPI